MSRPLILVACSGQKLTHRAPAGFMYQSDLFKKASAFAAARGDWMILSALHGAISPARLIDPYDARMPTRRVARWSWNCMVEGQLHDQIDRDLIVLAGQDYILKWIDAFRGSVERPLQGLGIGEQLRYLKAANVRAELAKAA